MEGKVVCELDQGEYELICFYRRLNKTRKETFMELVKTLGFLVDQNTQQKEESTQ